MNKKGETGIVAKILFGIVLFLTILIGFQAITLGAMSVGILTSSLYKLLGFGSILAMKIIYIATGISALIASMVLFVKVYLKR